MEAHVFNPITQRAKAGRCLWVRGQPGLHSEFHASFRWGSRGYASILGKPRGKDSGWEEILPVDLFFCHAFLEALFNFWVDWLSLVENYVRNCVFSWTPWYPKSICDSISEEKGRVYLGRHLSRSSADPEVSSSSQSRIIRWADSPESQFWPTLNKRSSLIIHVLRIRSMITKGSLTFPLFCASS